MSVLMRDLSDAFVTNNYTEPSVSVFLFALSKNDQGKLESAG